MRDASLKQRIPCIIRISIFGAFSAGKKCALYKGKYGTCPEHVTPADLAEPAFTKDIVIKYILHVG